MNDEDEICVICGSPVIKVEPLGQLSEVPYCDHCFRSVHGAGNDFPPGSTPPAIGLAITNDGEIHDQLVDPRTGQEV